ncbi:Malic enzyme [Meloidogyne graminicola]|uniref:Malic enzyme n=1 Tax=Meloidogyne graminicola TaxID=189291 RepID=A0A8T0A150_9BILA|nr:Malic enzyme [Meloidogyne graminicola]
MLGLFLKSLHYDIVSSSSERFLSTTKLLAKDWNLDDPKQKALYKLYRAERVTPTVRGVDLLKSPDLNKGMAFSLYERQYLGVHGLLPPAFMTEAQQAYRVITKLRKQPNDLARYIQLDALQDRNEKLFYRVLCDNLKELMPIVYTPTVGLACQQFGFIYRNPKGVYVTINDNSVSKIYQILSNWKFNEIKAIVVTDGERILGLGDLGTYGIGIPVGKLALYVALAGIQPRWCLPVLIDVGTDNQELLDDPFYIGLRRNRVTGPEYDTLLDNFMKACRKKYGQNVLIQFEDFGNKNAYRLLERYRDDYCMFNDDIQGTASVVVAGLLACTRVTQRKMSETSYVFLGAGGAALGIAEMVVLQMEKEGLSKEDACSKIYLMDVDGEGSLRKQDSSDNDLWVTSLNLNVLITTSRKNIEERHVPFAKNMAPTRSLLEVIKSVRPGALIGASTVGGAFTPEIIETMAEINPRPIIFALSNPTNKAECTAEDAFRFTKCSFASGSPFKNVELNGRIYKPGQGNNAYIFPGIALAAILFKLSTINNNLFLLAANTVAECVSDKCLAEGRIYSRLKDINEISIKIAIKIANECYKDGTAKLYPEPADKEMFIRSQLYSVEYEDLINETYEWPAQDMQHGFPFPPVNRDSMDD